MLRNACICADLAAEQEMGEDETTANEVTLDDLIKLEEASGVTRRWPQGTLHAWVAAVTCTLLLAMR